MVQDVFLWKGLEVDVDDSKTAEYLDLADWIDRRYPQYGPGVLYIRRLAGAVARPATSLPPLQWLSPRFVQRAARARVQLEDPLDADVHDLRVRFHRL